MKAQIWAREMALYSRWQNETLFELCARLTDAERRRDRGLFFGSIHHTLDHILLVDTLLRDYAATGTPPTGPFEPRRIVHEAFDALAEARARFDADLRMLIDEKDDAWFDATLPFASPGLEGVRDFPRWFFFTQMFNHATHHRAQVTGALHALGLDYGITDLPFNPLSQFST